MYIREIFNNGKGKGNEMEEEMIFKILCSIEKNVSEWLWVLIFSSIFVLGS